MISNINFLLYNPVDEVMIKFTFQYKQNKSSKFNFFFKFIIYDDRTIIL